VIIGFSRKESPMLALSLVLAVALPVGGAPKAGASAFVGPWNVRITDAADTFVGGGFDVRQTQGKLAASIVWRWGSVLPASTVDVEDGVLRMTREEERGKVDIFEARLDGKGLVGHVRYADGHTQHFEGRRAPELAASAEPHWGPPVTLFDGRSLDGWHLRDPKAKMGWAVVGGDLAVVDPKGNADLVTTRAFQDMKLHVEFNVEPHSNSGVYLRGRYEIQILDDPAPAKATEACGALYSRIAPRVDATRPAGEWQTYDITLVGRELTVVLNGTPIIEGATVEGITGGAIDPFEDQPGPVMLQGDHGKVRFRNVVVTPGL
jgi:3-keto-disaccharide hydrolase